jgi:LPS sulfotransferase NodH
VRAGIAPGHRDYRPFVIVSQARTGSNLLVSLLDSHPQIDARGELLRRLGGVPVGDRLGAIYGRKPRRIRAVGFKCFYYHPLDDRNAPIWTHLQGVDQLHVVHLRRRNVLRTLTSRRLAGLTGDWVEHGSIAGTAATAGKPTVRFNGPELREAFEQSEAWAATCEQRFRDHPVLDVLYEELIDTPAVRDEILAFLGVQAQPLRTSMQRQNPEPLAQLIEGFDDLRSEFEHTRWAPYFADG